MRIADLDAYFARIEYNAPVAADRGTLDALMAAHVAAIPFENLDVLLDRPISLELDAIIDKLVHQRRGGYCFEQNGLFLAVLAAIGFDVRPLSARVRIGRPRDFVPPRTHLFVRVALPDGPRIADVGVGGLSLTASIALDEDIEQPTPHEPRRLVREGGLWFHQARLGEAWSDVWEATLEEMPKIDQELANWYTSAHPASGFRARLIAARAAPAGGRVTLADRELTLRARDGVGVTRPIGDPDELLDVLQGQFGLVFPAGTRFRCPTF